MSAVSDQLLQELVDSFLVFVGFLEYHFTTLN